MSAWTHNKQAEIEIPEGATSFVYLITNLTNNKKYIGQKQLNSKVTRPPLKGKTRKRRSLKESNWKEYYGSSEQLKSDLILLGEDKFTREILFFCYSKSQLNYYETKLQMDLDVLFKTDYYNGIVNIRACASPQLKLLEIDYNGLLKRLKKL